MNEVPFLGDIGYVPAPKSFNWSLIIMVALAILGSGYCFYRFILKPLKSKDLELEKEKVDPLKVMVNRNLTV